MRKMKKGGVGLGINPYHSPQASNGLQEVCKTCFQSAEEECGGACAPEPALFSKP